jgi:hypothetical protein
MGEEGIFDETTVAALEEEEALARNGFTFGVLNDNLAGQGWPNAAIKQSHTEFGTPTIIEH